MMSKSFKLNIPDNQKLELFQKNIREENRKAMNQKALMQHRQNQYQKSQNISQNNLGQQDQVSNLNQQNQQINQFQQDTTYRPDILSNHLQQQEPYLSKYQTNQLYYVNQNQQALQQQINNQFQKQQQFLSNQINNYQVNQNQVNFISNKIAQNQNQNNYVYNNDINAQNDFNNHLYLLQQQEIAEQLNILNKHLNFQVSNQYQFQSTTDSSENEKYNNSYNDQFEREENENQLFAFVQDNILSSQKKKQSDPGKNSNKINDNNKIQVGNFLIESDEEAEFCSNDISNIEKKYKSNQNPALIRNNIEKDIQNGTPFKALTDHKKYDNSYQKGDYKNINPQFLTKNNTDPKSVENNYKQQQIFKAPQQLNNKNKFGNINQEPRQQISLKKYQKQNKDLYQHKNKNLLNNFNQVEKVDSQKEKEKFQEMKKRQLQIHQQQKIQQLNQGDQFYSIPKSPATKLIQKEGAIFPSPKKIFQKEQKRKEEFNQKFQQEIQQQLQKRHENLQKKKKNIHIQKKNMVQLGAYEYDESKLLGEGSFAKVYLGNRVGNPLEIVAVKVIDISKCDSRFQDEINILQKLQSEYIVKIFDHVIRAQQQKCYLILEYCDEGTLADVNPKLNRFQAMRFFLQIVEGMKVLDKNKIIHRDLKLENILVHKGVAKITDFGFAKRMLANQLLVQSVKCGSPATMAPEIYLNNQQYQQYSMKNDIFSLAVILHELFYKIHPYNYEQQRLQNRDRVKVSNPHNLVEDFIQRALQHNPHLRMGFEQLFEHELIITFKDFLELDNMGNPVSDDYLLKKLGNQFRNIDPENHQEMQRKKQFWNQLIDRVSNKFGFSNKKEQKQKMEIEENNNNYNRQVNFVQQQYNLNNNYANNFGNNRFIKLSPIQEEDNKIQYQVNSDIQRNQQNDCNNNQVSVKEIQQIGQIQFPNWLGGLLLAILVGTYIFKHMFV